MPKHLKDSVGPRRDVLSIEVSRSASTPSKWIEVSIALPGRHGAHLRTWTLGGGLVDDLTACDIIGFVGKMVDDALMATDGHPTSFVPPPLWWNVVESPMTP